MIELHMDFDRLAAVMAGGPEATTLATIYSVSAIRTALIVKESGGNLPGRLTTVKSNCLDCIALAEAAAMAGVMAALWLSTAASSGKRLDVILEEAKEENALEGIQKFMLTFQDQIGKAVGRAMRDAELNDTLPKYLHETPASELRQAYERLAEKLKDAMAKS